jgi:hypothetical protein
MRSLKAGIIWVVIILLVMSSASANQRKSFLCNSINGSQFVNTSSAKFSDPTNFGFHEGETLVLEIGSMNATFLRLEVPDGQLAAAASGVSTLSYRIPGGGLTSLSISATDGAFTGTLWCYTATEAEVYFSSGGAARDARLNADYGDLIGVIYLDTFQGEDLGLRLYEVDGEGQGNFRCSVHQSDLTALAGAQTNRALAIDCGDRIQLYRLTTGELQVMLGPDAEGKTYTLVFDPATMKVTARA